MSNPNRFTVQQDDLGYMNKRWYVARVRLDSGDMIWADGQIHFGGRRHPLDDFPGWFKTRREARNALALYRRLT